MLILSKLKLSLCLSSIILCEAVGCLHTQFVLTANRFSSTSWKKLNPLSSPTFYLISHKMTESLKNNNKTTINLHLCLRQ